MEEQKTVIANCYTIKCIAEILGEVNIRGLMLHQGMPLLIPQNSHTINLTKTSSK